MSSRDGTNYLVLVVVVVVVVVVVCVGGPHGMIQAQDQDNISTSTMPGETTTSGHRYIDAVKMEDSKEPDASLEHDWVFHDIDTSNGPTNWWKTYPDCGNKMQSPININTKEIRYDPNLIYFNLADYSKTDNVQMALENNGGRKLFVKLAGEPLILRAGSLPDEYHVSHIGFNWGTDNKRGSGHSINGKFFPMEMHIIHYQYHLGSLRKAISKPHGLATLCFFIKVGKPNSNWDALVNQLPRVANPGNITSIPVFRLAKLIPKTNNLDYVRYVGSLTYPPCHESIIWSVVTESIEISEDQLSKFRSLYTDAVGHRMVQVFRPTQPLNSRSVTGTALFQQTGKAKGCCRAHAYLPPVVFATALSVALFLWRII